MIPDPVTYKHDQILGLYQYVHIDGFGWIIHVVLFVSCFF